MIPGPTAGVAASTIGRRTVLTAGAGAALAAAAPKTAAGKQKRQPPVAFVTMTMTGVRNFVAGANRAFAWDFAASLQHPASGINEDFAGSANTPVEATPTQARAAIVQGMQELVSTMLANKGPIVPPERISVVVL